MRQTSSHSMHNGCTVNVNEWKSTNFYQCQFKSCKSSPIR